MIVLGIDPGTHVSGYALVEFPSMEVLRIGAWEGDGDNEDERILDIVGQARSFGERVPRRWNRLGIEQQFVGRNAGSGLSVSRAAGALLAVLGDRPDTLVLGVHPSRVKSVCGGAKDKAGVRKHVTELFGVRNPELPDDSFDALAIAWIAAGMEVSTNGGHSRPTPAREGRPCG